MSCLFPVRTKFIETVSAHAVNCSATTTRQNVRGGRGSEETAPESRAIVNEKHIVRTPFRRIRVSTYLRDDDQMRQPRVLRRLDGFTFETVAFL